jgi:hypothetical protein
MKPRHRAVIARNALVLAAAIALSGTLAGAGGERLQVHLDQPFQIGEQRFSSGTITVKTIREYNPSTTLHELWVDGDCLGMMMSRRNDRLRYEAVRDVLHFHRGEAGQLVLVGFATRNTQPASLYHYGRVRQTARGDVARTESEPILIAASSR